MLSQQAFNAFLKTLEEPPAHAIFILATTEKHKILPTILSRCQTYDFNRISVENIVKNLRHIAKEEDVEISEDAMHIIAQKADGAMRDALTLFDQTVAFCGREVTYEQVIKNLNVLDYDYYFKLTDDFLKGDFASALLTFDEILSKGFNALHFISGLSSHFRDLIVCKDNASQTLLELAPTVAEKYKSESRKCGAGFLFDALSCTTACETGYRQSGNPRLLIEFTLMKICRLCNAPAAASFAPAPASSTVSAPAPAAAPAPVAETAPAPAPAEKKSTGLSIKDVLKQVSQPVQASDASDSAAAVSVPFDEVSVKNVWIQMAQNESKMPRLSSAISQTEPVVDIEKKEIRFVVGNDAQKAWIDRNCRNRLEAFIQHNMGDPAIRLLVEVIQPDESLLKKKLYMPSDKADYLQANSDEFRELKKDLDLEIK